MSLRAFQNYEIGRGRTSGKMIFSKMKSSTSNGVVKTSYNSSQILNVDYSEIEMFQKKLKKMGVSLDRRKLITLIKRAIKPTLEAAKQNVAAIESASTNDTNGYLYDSLGFITGKSKSFVNVQVGPRVKGQWKYKGYYGAWLEFGHTIRKTRKGPIVGNARPFAYMKPAYDKTVGTSITNFQREVINYVEEVAKKTL